MLKHARGVLCAPITVSRCKELDLPHQVSDNTSVLGTPFTVTIDKLEGCTTGVSAADRAATIQALADPTSTPATFGRPGHINPLYAQEKGVLRRAGHTEATIDMCRLSGFYPAGALMEIMNEDGTMARLPELRKMADEFNLKLISIRDMIAYRLQQESIVEKGVEVDMPTEHGHFRSPTAWSTWLCSRVLGRLMNLYWCVYTPLAPREIYSAPCVAIAASSCTRRWR